MNVPASRDKIQLVNAESLECELNRVRAAAAGSLSGIFGPRSVTWQVDREAAIFLGAGRALLLQLAHPWVAAAIEQHSDTFADPIGRFHRTFSVVFSMVFGSLDQSLSAARSLHRRHTEIKGQLPLAAGPFPAGSCYYANAVPALCWVHATLIETALLSYELVLPPFTPEQREHYYTESRLFAALFGIPDDYLPRDWAAFSAYIASVAQSDTLTVTDQARIMAHRLIAGADTWLPVPTSYRALTAALLPPQIREAFGFLYGAAEQRAVRQLIAGIRRAYPFLPARLRYVGPYQEAEQRLAGKARPDIVTRLCNRFWIGRAELPREPVG
ncbi:MAG: oxygenase MpaB family protein [Bradyrhizobium sp.]|nr:oxygenase MpaB family protein [Bradyrhizobium sp.]